jgi:alpha-galactosidase/6-phospho-beta-glucosidase family protein
MQVTIIGGGSYQWGPKLITDLLGTPSLAGVHLVLEDIDAGALATMERYARRADEILGSKATITATTDQGAALDGADFVVVTISTGGFESMAVDLDVPARHGIVQSVGDSVGPGGISRALRNIPVLVGVARDMERHCPDAWMLNITNPMTCLTRSVTKATSVKTVGLCHEVGNSVMLLAVALGLPHIAIHPTVTGINHFPVVTELDIDGSEGFEVIDKMVDELGGLAALSPAPGEPEADPFSPLGFGRENLLKLTFLDRTGALPAAGDRHLAEFVPGVLTEASDFGRSWGIEPTPISKRQDDQDGFIADVDAVLRGDKEMETWDSGELVAPVIDSLVTGTRRELPLNIPNAGQCPDLPLQSVVESICVVDGDGIRGRDEARAPAPLAELLRRHVAVQELTVEAATTGDRSLVAAAAALDPLAGRGDMTDTEAMVDELLAGTARWLPQFAPADADRS